MNDPDGQPAVDGKDPLLGEDPPFELTTISAQDIARMPIKKPGPVTLQDLQGVFAHSFKCSICDLEFVVFSWRANRHRVGSTLCPECGCARRCSTGGSRPRRVSSSVPVVPGGRSTRCSLLPTPP